MERSLFVQLQQRIAGVGVASVQQRNHELSHLEARRICVMSSIETHLQTHLGGGASAFVVLDNDGQVNVYRTLLRKEGADSRSNRQPGLSPVGVRACDADE